MEDMSKAYDGTEETSRAMELYEGALSAAGNAAQKYAIYQDSITAAQDKMNASFEKWGSLLSGTVIKGFYNGVANLFSGTYDALFGGDESYDYSGVMSSIQGQVDFLSPLVDEYKKLNDVKDRTEAQDQRMTAIIETLAGKNRELKTALTDSNGEFLSGQTAVDAMTQALIGYQEQLDKLSLREIKDKIKESKEDIASAQGDVKKAETDETILDIIKTYMQEKFDTDDIFSLTEKQLRTMFNNMQLQNKGTFLGLGNFDWFDQMIELLAPDGKTDEAASDRWYSFFDD